MVFVMPKPLTAVPSSTWPPMDHKASGGKTTWGGFVGLKKAKPIPMITKQTIVITDMRPFLPIRVQNFFIAATIVL
jgi:hypothetical protein